MARGHQKIQSQQKAAEKQAKLKKQSGHSANDQKKAAQVALKASCSVCKVWNHRPLTKHRKHTTQTSKKTVKNKWRNRKEVLSFKTEKRRIWKKNRESLFCSHTNIVSFSFDVIFFFLKNFVKVCLRTKIVSFSFDVIFWQFLLFSISGPDAGSQNLQATFWEQASQKRLARRAQRHLKKTTFSIHLKIDQNVSPFIPL